VKSRILWNDWKRKTLFCGYTDGDDDFFGKNGFFIRVAFGDRIAVGVGGFRRLVDLASEVRRHGEVLGDRLVLGVYRMRRKGVLFPTRTNRSMRETPA